MSIGYQTTVDMQFGRMKVLVLNTKPFANIHPRFYLPEVRNRLLVCGYASRDTISVDESTRMLFLVHHSNHQASSSQTLRTTQLPASGPLLANVVATFPHVLAKG